jgi:hypothetical protein
MIVGMLLLYIGIRFNFPGLYLFGCWAVILIRFLTHFCNFMKGVNDAGRGNESD